MDNKTFESMLRVMIESAHRRGDERTEEYATNTLTTYTAMKGESRTRCRILLERVFITKLRPIGDTFEVVE